MSKPQTVIADDVTSEIAILGRVLSNGKDLAPALARHLLELGFSAEENQRINDLAERNRQSALSAHEQAELRGFVNAGCWLGILHAKARRALKKASRK